jgi:hypothetical protein
MLDGNPEIRQNIVAKMEKYDLKFEHFEGM